VVDESNVKRNHDEELTEKAGQAQK